MRRLLLSALVPFSLVIWATDAVAISAWARRSGISCTVCHVRINRMNQTGLNMYRMGFRTGLGEAESQNLGDYFSVQGNIRTTGKKEEKNPVGQFKLTLYGGGPLNKNFSFLGETTLNPPGDQEIADLFLQYTTTSKNFASVRFGQFLPLLMVDNPVEVAADRGAPFPRERRFGLEAGYSVGDRAWGAAAIVESADPLGAGGEQLYDGVFNAQYIVDDQGTSLGGFAWVGRYHSDPTDLGKTDDFTRFGLIGNYNNRGVLLSAGFVSGKGSSTDAGSASTSGAYGNAEYMVRDWLVPVVNYAWFDPDTDTDKDQMNVLTASLFLWATPYVTVRPSLIYRDPSTGDSDYTYLLEARFMY